MSFQETKERLNQNVKIGSKGNRIHSFSKNDFNDLVNAMLNDVEYRMETVKLINGVATEVSKPIVKEFREKLIVPILVKAGIKRDAAKKFAMNYSFNSNQTVCLYDFISDILYQYVDAGKKFNFPNRQDFVGSIYLKENEPETVERDIRSITDHKTVTGHKIERREKHKTIVKKSSCPSWMRHVL